MTLSFWRSWVTNCAIGELIGMGITTFIVIGRERWLGEPNSLAGKWLELLLVLAAGMIAGYLLGTFQARVLGRRYRHFSPEAWVRITVLAAGIAWVVGMSYPVFFASNDTVAARVSVSEPVLFVLLSISLGMTLGAIFGGCQMLMMRHWAKHASRWIMANALGWGLGIFWIYLGASLISIQTPFWMVLAIGASAGLLAGVSLGGITALVMPYMPPKKLDTPSEE